MPPGGRVIVEPTAKLIIDGGTITTFCNDMWKGIEVWGNLTASQAINATTQMPLYQGMLSIINGGTVENATYGVSLIATDGAGNVDWNKTGGIIQAVGASFINNNKDIAFWPYTPTSVSYFKGCTFSLGNRSWSGWTDNRVSLYGVSGVQFLGNTFVNTSTYFSNGIYALDANFTANDYGTSQNSFNNFDYGIYVTNTSSLKSVNITHATFTNNRSGGIYLGSAYYSTIQTCTFTLNSTSSVTVPDYGVYLNNCNGYGFLNNVFNGVSNGYLHEGAYINSSGPYSNSAYNNTFNNLTYGLWAAGVNLGGNPLGSTGLIMNCNDFTNCTYNMGVQGTIPGSHGVAKVQGVHNVPANYSRNTYSTPACTNQNKFYINGANSTGISHANFIGIAYQPIPQPACGSNLITVYQDAGTYNKSTYCPANPCGCSGCCKIADLIHSIGKQSVALHNLLDDSVNSGNSETARQIEALTDELTYNKNHLGILLNEKIRDLLNDTTLTNPTDSVIALLSSDNSISTRKLLLAAHLAKKDFVKAKQQLNFMKNQSNVHKDFCDYYQLLLNMQEDPTYVNTMKGDELIKHQLLTYANDYTSEVGAMAITQLQLVYGIKVKETILLPDATGAGKVASLNDEVLELLPNIKLYPNPASNVINVEYSLEENEVASVTISDVTGRVIKTAQLKPKTNVSTLDVTEIPTGVYFISLIKNNSALVNKKIVISK